MIRSLGLLTVCLLAAAASAQKRDPKPTLDKLDASSKTFVNFQADVKQEHYTSLVKQTDTETGKIYSIKGKNGSEVGIQIGPRTVHYKDGVAKDYTAAKIACYNTYKAAQNKGTFDTLLTLAFGTSGKELDAKWVVTDLGEEKLKVDKTNTPVEKLDLVPKDQSLKSSITHITLWIDLAKAYSPKLVNYSPSGDTITATYSNIRLNEKKVDTKPFDIPGKPCK